MVAILNEVFLLQIIPDAIRNAETPSDSDILSIILHMCRVIAAWTLLTLS
jgi:hypothetical protein